MGLFRSRIRGDTQKMNKPWWKEDVRNGRAISLVGLVGFAMILAASHLSSRAGTSLVLATGLVLLIGSGALFLREIHRLRQSSLGR